MKHPLRVLVFSCLVAQSQTHAAPLSITKGDYVSQRIESHRRLSSPSPSLLNETTVTVAPTQLPTTRLSSSPSSSPSPIHNNLPSLRKLVYWSLLFPIIYISFVVWALGKNSRRRRLCTTCMDCVFVNDTLPEEIIIRKQNNKKATTTTKTTMREQEGSFSEEEDDGDDYFNDNDTVELVPVRTRTTNTTNSSSNSSSSHDSFAMNNNVYGNMEGYSETISDFHRMAEI